MVLPKYRDETNYDSNKKKIYIVSYCNLQGSSF